MLSLGCAVAGAAVLSTASTAGAAPPPATNGKTYVALGDSYAAGFGLPAPSTPTGQPVAGCEQTTGDYPHILAMKLGLSLTDVTCSGATTADFTSPQSVTGPPPPAQLDVFKTHQPDLVTITIGGNDLGFTSIATACAATAPSGPTARVVGNGSFTFSTCQDYFNSTGANGGKTKNPYDDLASVIGKVKAAIGAVHKAAPKAKIAVIAYPAIAPNAANTPAGGCYTSLTQAPNPPANPFPSALPFTNADVPYLQVLQQQLDAGIGQAATQLGASYADIYPSSLSHSACQPENTRWVEPIDPGDPPGTNVLHPNLAGTTAMANALAPVVTQLLTPAPSSVPPSSSTSSAASSSAASGSPAAASATPLANTGTTTPVGQTILVGALLVGAGAGLLLLTPAARRRRGAHR